MKKESIELYYAFNAMASAKEHLELIISSKQVNYSAKNKIKTMLNRINANISDLKFFAPDLSNKIVNEALSNENVLQVENIKSMFAQLPPAKRDEVEKYIELQYNVYRQKS